MVTESVAELLSLALLDHIIVMNTFWVQMSQQFYERNFLHDFGIEPSKVNQGQMVQVFVTAT